MFTLQTLTFFKFSKNFKLIYVKNFFINMFNFYWRTLSQIIVHTKALIIFINILYLMYKLKNIINKKKRMCYEESYHLSKRTEQKRVRRRKGNLILNFMESS